LLIVLYGLIDAAYKEGYAAYASKVPCPYFITGTDECDAELKEAWDRGYDDAYSDELDAYMTGLSRLNSEES